MIPIRMTIFFFPKTLRPKSFQKRSILWFSGPTGVELQKFTSGSNAVRLTMVFGPAACVIQLVWTHFLIVFLDQKLWSIFKLGRNEVDQKCTSKYLSIRNSRIRVLSENENYCECDSKYM